MHLLVLFLKGQPFEDVEMSRDVEALALIRGLEGECMSPKMSLKLRQDPRVR